MENTLQRIKKFIDYKGISIRLFEQSIGMSNGSFASQLKNNKTIGVDKLENILHIYEELNPEWLLTGKGEMLKNEEDREVEHAKRSGKEDIDLSDLIDAVNSIAKVSANNSETEKIRAETDRIKAEEDKIRAEAELKRAEVEDRNSRNMEELIMLLKSEKQDGSDRMRVKKEILY